MDFRLALLSIVLLAGCASKPAEEISVIGNEPPKPQVLRFLAFGDAGSGSAQ